MLSYHKDIPETKFETIQTEARCYANYLNFNNQSAMQDLEANALRALIVLDKRTEITSKDFALLIFTYLGTRDLLSSCRYLKDLNRKHLEKLFEIFSWTSNTRNSFVMDRRTFVRAFLFCVSIDNNRWPAQFSLAEYIDYIYEQKGLLKGNLYLHLQSEVDKLLNSFLGEHKQSTPSYLFSLDGGRNHGDKSYGLLLMLNILDKDNKRVIHYPLIPTKKFNLEKRIRHALSTKIDLSFCTPIKEHHSYFRVSLPKTDEHEQLVGLGQGWVAVRFTWDAKDNIVNFWNMFDTNKKEIFKLPHPAKGHGHRWCIPLPDYRFAVISVNKLYVFQIDDAQAPKLHRSRDLHNDEYEENQLYNGPILFNGRYVIHAMPSNSKSRRCGYSLIDIHFIDCEQNQDYSTKAEAKWESVGYNFLISCFPSTSEVLFKNRDGSRALFILDMNFSITGEIVSAKPSNKLFNQKLKNFEASQDGKYALYDNTLYECSPISFHRKECSPEFADKLKQSSLISFLYDNRMLMNNAQFPLLICDATNESFKELKLPEEWENSEPSMLLPEGDLVFQKNNEHLLYADTSKLSHEIYQSLPKFPRVVCDLITNYVSNSVSLVGLFSHRQRALPVSAEKQKLNSTALDRSSMKAQ